MNLILTNNNHRFNTLNTIQMSGFLRTVVKKKIVNMAFDVIYNMLVAASSNNCHATKTHPLRKLMII